MSTILSIKQITKSYGPVLALNGVSFDVPEGSVFGVLGPNGSGKTTLLGIAMNVLQMDAGSYGWFGNMPHDAARKKIGALLETPNFYHYLSAMDNLRITAAIRGYGENDRLRVLGLVNLLERKDSKFHTYSLGMKQRLAIGAALLGAPKVLVLDEPTNGLDPAGIAEVRELIKKLNGEGYTIIMASHLLYEVEQVCTHVAILKKGNLLLTGPVDEVLRSEDQVELKADNTEELRTALQQMPGIQKVDVVNNTVVVTTSHELTTRKLNEYCIQKGIVLTHLLLKKKSLETKFMELTN